MQKGEELREALQEIINFVKSHDLIIGEDDEWVKFLGEALGHNWAKLCEADCQDKLSSLQVT